jgi:hypothetical protein
VTQPEQPDVVLIPSEAPPGISGRPADGALAAASSPRQFSKKRLFLAFLIAGISDVVCAFFTWAPPVVWAIDFLTAALLFIVLGWSWWLLPGLLMEAIPGLDVLPFWVLVVGGIAIFGSPRPKLK